MPLEQLVPDDFAQKWQKDGIALVLFPDEYLWPQGVPLLDRKFLSQVGLPQFAAPNMHFDHEEATPCDAYGQLLKGIDSRLTMIGSTAESFPICFDPDKPQHLVCIRLEPNYPLQFLNSSTRHLAACLLAYRDVVEKALAYGRKKGHDDAWRQGKFPREYKRRLQNEIRLIDSLAMADDTYWPMHFHGLDDTDCHRDKS